VAHAGGRVSSSRWSYGLLAALAAQALQQQPHQQAASWAGGQGSRSTGLQGSRGDIDSQLSCCPLLTQGMRRSSCHVGCLPKVHCRPGQDSQGEGDREAARETKKTERERERERGGY